MDAFKVKVDSGNNYLVCILLSFHRENTNKYDLFIIIETFEIKSRFPPNLKPPLMEILTAAYERSQFNENLFKILTNILPYNKFTVTVGITFDI